MRPGTQVRAPSFVLVLVAGLACGGCGGLVPVSVSGSPEAGFGVAGYVEQAPAVAAVGVSVTLKAGDSGKALASTTTDWMGKYEFLGLRPGIYRVEAGAVGRPVVIGRADVRLDLDLSTPTGEVDYGARFAQGMTSLAAEGGAGKAGGGSSRGGSSGGARAAPAEPSDPGLQRSMAGSYYGYSGGGSVTGGTERRLIFCPDGTFTYQTESGYSGGAGTSAAWGAASQGGYTGRWSIQGTESSGTFSLQYDSGESETLRYDGRSSHGCYTINGATMCYEGPGNCR